jgi:hypothetical protein
MSPASQRIGPRASPLTAPLASPLTGIPKGHLAATVRSHDHPVVGNLTLEWDALTSDVEPDQQLIVYTAERGSRAEQALRELAAWASEHIKSPSLL